MASYDAGFYDVIRAGSQASAAVVAPLVAALIPDGARVIDVGCGEGWWAQAFADLGAEVIGIDGAYVETSPLGDRFIRHDLNTALPEHLAGRFDLAVSLEVAEHLDPARARSFVADLCALAPIVLFSAAIPGQGGTGHVNEQWPAYWVELFTEHEFMVSGALRWQIWNDDRVENWYRQNLMVAVEPTAPTSHELAELFSTPLATMFPVVHPVLYDARRR